MYSLGILDTGLVGMICHTNTIQEILWPKELAEDIETMHDKNGNKVLFCSLLHPVKTSRFILRT